MITALGTAAYAARQCKLYSYGGYSDWFLPSLDEETQMLTALALNGLGGFTVNVSYWSSSEYWTCPDFVDTLLRCRSLRRAFFVLSRRSVAQVRV
jgi:hypothetical protein